MLSAGQLVPGLLVVELQVQLHRQVSHSRQEQQVQVIVGWVAEELELLEALARWATEGPEAPWPQAQEGHL